jgi:signal transduction histidine kinase
MGTRLKRSFLKVWQLLGAADLHGAIKSGVVHILFIFAIALLFYGVESIIEYFARDIDNVVDIFMAIASTFILLWLRATHRNANLSEMLRVQSEERTKELEIRVSEIAHEFQTPLVILKGNIAVLAEPKKSRAAMRIDAAYVATATIDRLSRLVSDLLAVARLNFSKEKFLRQPVDVGQLIEAARDDCAILAEDKKISISAKFSERALFVAGDKDRLKEVLLNLLSNALKHTPTGGSISITADTRDGLEYPDGEVEIMVADTGSGIPPDRLPHIFERFYRIESSGTGLGLHICRQIVEVHGGSITAESEPDKGSRFIIRLPTLRLTAS